MELLTIIIGHDGIIITAIIKEKKDYDSQKVEGYMKKISEVEIVNFFFFGANIRMVVITVEAYSNAQVHTITVKNKELFWVKMKDVQDGFVVKCISDLLRK